MTTHRRTDDHLRLDHLVRDHDLSWWLAPGHTRGAAAVASVPITWRWSSWDSSRDA